MYKRQFQASLVRSHSAGTGEPMPDEVVRAMMALRVNAFASNHSGVRVAIIDRLIAMLNHGITPVVPSKGSVGASGDLAPLALMSGALMGLPESRVTYRGEMMPAARAFEQAGMAPTMDVQAKDATALINGATASLAYAVLTAHDARELLGSATLSMAMTLEALRGELSCFEDRVMLARPHRGQRRVAAAIRQLVAGSQRCTEPARQLRLRGTPGLDPAQAGTPHTPPLAPRIQDVYSLRCVPQVYGPVLDALDYIDGILATEMNSATDNPLIFPEEAGYAIVSGGHFHGQYIAQAMDLLALAVADLSAICDRRSARLVDPACNFGLPANLIAQRPGINTGFSVVQSMGTGLVLENMGLCGPASATSLPAKGNTEDHISNSCFAARRTRTAVSYTHLDVYKRQPAHRARGIDRGVRIAGRRRRAGSAGKCPPARAAAGRRCRGRASGESGGGGREGRGQAGGDRCLSCAGGGGSRGGVARPGLTRSDLIRPDLIRPGSNAARPDAEKRASRLACLFSYWVRPRFSRMGQSGRSSPWQLLSLIHI